MIALVVTLFIIKIGYDLQVKSLNLYHYNILSVGGVAVSFIGTLFLVFAACCYCKGFMIQGSISMLLGATPYALMAIRDYHKTNNSIKVAVISMLFRFVVSTLVLLFIGWYLTANRCNISTKVS